MEPWMVARIAAVLIAVPLGVTATYLSILRSSTPEERTLRMRALLICWLSVPVAIVALRAVPPPWHYAFWIAYAIALVALLRRTGARVRRDAPGAAPADLAA